MHYDDNLLACLHCLLVAYMNGFTRTNLLPIFPFKHVVLVITDSNSLQAIAGEAGVPFFYRAGSEFEEMYDIQLADIRCFLFYLTSYYDIKNTGCANEFYEDACLTA